MRNLNPETLGALWDLSGDASFQRSDWSVGVHFVSVAF